MTHIRALYEVVGGWPVLAVACLALVIALLS